MSPWSVVAFFKVTICERLVFDDWVPVVQIFGSVKATSLIFFIVCVDFQSLDILAGDNHCAEAVEVRTTCISRLDTCNTTRSWHTWETTSQTKIAPTKNTITGILSPWVWGSDQIYRTFPKDLSDVMSTATLCHAPQTVTSEFESLYMRALTPTPVPAGFRQSSSRPAQTLLPIHEITTHAFSRPLLLTTPPRAFPRPILLTTSRVLDYSDDNVFLSHPPHFVYQLPAPLPDNSIIIAITVSVWIVLFMWHTPRGL